MSDSVPTRGVGIKVLSGVQAAQFTKIKHTQSLQVAKKGRTTGWTYEHINQIGSLLNLRRDSRSIVPVDMEQRFGSTDGIMLALGVMHDLKGREFMRAGDYGSCVLLNERGRRATVIGLLYASNEYSRVAYMIPFDLVVRDIELVTDQKVVKPEFVEYDART